MTPQTELEIQGNLFTHPSAELIAELCTSAVTGSLRLECKERKSIVYFNAGRLVFAVSNARNSRLFQVLMDTGRAAEENLAKIPNVANDIELAAYLKASSLVSTDEVNGAFKEQIEQILRDLLRWTDGSWTFSPLKRLREGLEFNIDVPRLLLEHARQMPSDVVVSRFRTLSAAATASSELRPDIVLTREEVLVMSYISSGAGSIADVVSLSGMSEPQTLQAVYALWLAGLLVRDDCRGVLSREVLASFKEARLAVKQEAKMPSVQVIQTPAAEAELAAEAEPPPEEPVDIEEYLARVENAATYYDVLSVETRAELPAIKASYLNIAKTFHPDKFHTEDGELLKRLQNAFAAVMQAHEALKTQESRDLYDYRMRKELLDREKARAAGTPQNVANELDQASVNFERGFSLLMDGDTAAATPYLARAVHYAPRVARYHAYYGKALSSDAKQRHKAESEMQSALKLDPENPTYRLLLAEFFIQVNLMKRAEGELNRLLAAFPNNREAMSMLASLKARA